MLTINFKIKVLLALFLLFPAAVAEGTDIKSSTQFLWGDDLLGKGQAIMAEYLKFNYHPEGKTLSMTGYGRVWEDFTDSEIRDDDPSIRLYYLYMNYFPSDRVSFRLGRQFVNFTSGSSIIDGISMDVSSAGPVGIAVAGGTDVRFSLDGDHSMLGDYFFGLNFHLENIRATQAGLSYVRRYDEWDRAREEFGLNFRRSFGYLSPYSEIRYDRLSKAINEAVIGIDLFPIDNLMVKGEFYYSYPTFDSTSLYSAFAVDKYREYRIEADYSLEAPVSLSALYVREAYEDDDNANVYRLGAGVYPTDKLALNISADRRTDFGGKIWGFEVYCDYRARDKFYISAGAQLDAYRRPSEEFSDDTASRFWLGGKWHFKETASIAARIEDNINENFAHRPLGRVVLDWEF